LVGNAEEKKQLGRWGENIKVDLKEIRCERVGFVPLVQVREECRAVLNTAMKLLAL
jgi:hypothetical protein